MTILQRPSPSFGPRRDGVSPDLVVLHYTAMESCAAAAERLCAPEFEVSAHYLISEHGAVLQLVAEEMRAWHAGSGAWGSVADVNSRSIGIELANTGFQPFSEPQMDALETLLGDIRARWAIAPERVIGHSDMAPARKIDPGARFDWRRLALGGLSVWPDPDEAGEMPFREAATRFGYPTDVDDEVLLSAVRMRFRSHATGPLDDVDRAMMQNLAQRFPVDQTRASA